MRNFIKAIVCGATLSLSGAAMALEEPKFDVIYENDDYEIRQYEPYLVAEVTVEGSYDETGDDAFRTLAEYIFGNNQPREKMAMTKPVTAQKESGVKMEMTAPVTAQATSDSGEKMEMTAPVSATAAEGDSTAYKWRFVMERKYTMDNLPKPVNDEIEIIQVPAKTVAAMRYRGFTTHDNFVDNRDELLELLNDDEIRTVSTPVAAVYNGPFTLPFLRRNEVLVEIDPQTLGYKYAMRSEN